MNPGPRKNSSLGRRMLLVMMSLALGLVAAELVVRLLGLAPEVVPVKQGRFQRSANPRLGYEPVPHFENTAGVDTFGDFIGKSNSLGFRDQEWALDKPPGTRRILVLGDSIAAGQGIRDAEQIFPALLELGLRETGIAAEVLNFGVSGYNTLQEVEILKEKGLAFKPDWVLVAYCLNDTRLDDGGVLSGLEALAGGATAAPSHRLNPRLAPSALYRLVWYTLSPRVSPSDAATGSVNAGGVSAAFDELGQLSRRHGFRVMVAVFPRFGGLSDTYRYADQHTLPKLAAERNSFVYLDLLPAFQACHATADGRLARDRYHPTARGHRCAAEAMAAAFRQIP